MDYDFNSPLIVFWLSLVGGLYLTFGSTACGIGLLLLSTVSL